MGAQEDFRLAVTVRLYGPGTAGDAAAALRDWRGTFHLSGEREAEIIGARPAATAPRFAEIVRAIEQARLLTRNAPRVTPAAADTGWMPFNPFDFAALLFEASPLIPQDTPETPPRFLEVGAGPGPNMIIARDAFGMDVSGIEVHDALAAAGRDAGLAIEAADADDWTGYEKFDAVWLNRPRRDAAAERRLEERVYAEMTAGAVLLCANLETRPPESWFIISDSWEALRRGAWAKPHAAAGGQA